MTPAAFRAARKRLGLTGDQMAPLLGYQARQRVSEIERRDEDVPEPQARLMQAYLDGYRPKDWPLTAAAAKPRRVRG